MTQALPGTLGALFATRLVPPAWRYDKENRHCQKIANVELKGRPLRGGAGQGRVRGVVASRGGQGCWLSSKMEANQPPARECLARLLAAAATHTRLEFCFVVFLTSSWGRVLAGQAAWARRPAPLRVVRHVWRGSAVS